jgi:DNA-binding CsgD family transcriptional regulator
VPARAIDVYTRLYELPPGENVPAYVAAGLQCLGAALGSDEGYVVLVLRAMPPQGDPLFGFRPVYNFTIGRQFVESTELTAELLRNDDLLIRDPILRRMVESAGRHRSFHDPDPRLSPATRDTVDAQYWTVRGLVDRVKLVHALDANRELHIGFDRSTGMEPFGPAETALLEPLTRGIGPWARRIALLHGEGPAMTPLAPRERDTLCQLLSDRPQKSYAQALGVSDARARELVRLVYRKLRVASRSELMTLWSVRPQGPSPLPAVEWRDRAGGRATQKQK